MTLVTALMTAIGSMATVIVCLAGVVAYLYKELRAESRLRAKDSALFLTTLERLRGRRSERPPELQRSERPTPTETPSLLEGGYHYSTRQKTNPTRR